VVWAFFL